MFLPYLSIHLRKQKKLKRKRVRHFQSHMESPSRKQRRLLELSTMQRQLIPPPISSQRDSYLDPMDEFLSQFIALVRLGGLSGKMFLLLFNMRKRQKNN